ncbi:hypothetical protein WJX81_000719 [Elliptochloris bilobata]|uniref:J domain-containing protein n=1 Tax=Elliptochloris bilobata TaxID=381761 RepID=A0AAW1RFR9_9CHLO
MTSGNEDDAEKLFPTAEAKELLVTARSGGPAPQVREGEANGLPAANGVRQRSGQAAESSSRQTEEKATPKQRELVVKVRRATCYYEILGIARGATDDEIKRAYRKLALKLHPDKCTVRGADEAFKAVSRAFSCLSNAQKRAAYDRDGEERAPGAPRQWPTGGGGGGGGFDDFDPEEIFNMFFNGGNPTRGRVFRAHFGGPGFRPAGPRQQGGAQAQATSPVLQLLHLLPVLALLLFTLLSSPGQPVFSMDKAGEWRDKVVTQRYAVPFYVKDQTALRRSYPPGSRERLRLEGEVEVAYKQRLEQRCYNERLTQQKLYRWGQSERARSMELPNCSELNSRFGHRMPFYGY